MDEKIRLKQDRQYENAEENQIHQHSIVLGNLINLLQLNKTECGNEEENRYINIDQSCRKFLSLFTANFQLNIIM